MSYKEHILGSPPSNQCSFSRTKVSIWMSLSKLGAVTPSRSIFNHLLVLQTLINTSKGTSSTQVKAQPYRITRSSHSLKDAPSLNLSSYFNDFGTSHTPLASWLKLWLSYTASLILCHLSYLYPLAMGFANVLTRWLYNLATVVIPFENPTPYSLTLPTHHSSQGYH